MYDIGYAAQLSTRRSNYLLDLTDKVPQALLDEFYPNANSPCYVNGKLLCMRNDIAHDVVWYDKPLMESLGAEVPTTWEEYRGAGRRTGRQGLCARLADGAVPGASSSRTAATWSCRSKARTIPSRST